MKPDSNSGPWPGPFIQRDYLGRTYRILAILPDNPTGTAAANAVCAAIPGASVLAVRSGEILVAHKDDVGTPRRDPEDIHDDAMRSALGDHGQG